MAAGAAVNGTRKSSRAKAAPQVNGKAEDAKTTKATKASKAATTKAVATKAPLSEKAANTRTTKAKRAAAEPESEDEEQQPAKKPKSQEEAMKENQTDEKSSKAVKESTRKAPPKKEAAKKPPAAPGARSKKAARTVTNALPTPPNHERPPKQLFAWGAGNFGQFGMGLDHLDEFDKPKKNVWVEKKIEDGLFGDKDAGLETIAAGGLHTMFIDEKGTIWTCGVNDDAALGRITKDVPDPENEGKLLDVDVLTSFPHPLQTLVDEGFRAVSIAAGDSICAAISDEGELRVWGSFRANEGALGFSDGSRYQSLPAPILTLPAEEKVSSVAAGNNHLVVLTTYGNIYTWGAGEQGQLGRKVLERRKIHGTHPEKVTLRARSTKAMVVGAGNYTSFAVDEKGDVWGWGLNSMGQVGSGYEDEDDTVVLLPQKVIGLSKEELGGATVIRIAGGEHHTLFLISDGRVFACGRSNGGQLGLVEDHPAFKAEGYEGFVAEPTLVAFPDSPSADPVVHISSGTHSNMAVTASGALYSWGEGNQGELGIGDETDAKTPQVVVRKEGGSWKAISAECGGQHCLGLFKKKKA